MITQEQLIEFQKHMHEQFKDWDWHGEEAPDILIMAHVKPIYAADDTLIEKGVILGQTNVSCPHCLIMLVESCATWLDTALSGTMQWFFGDEKNVKH
jgi:hypothetical protein